MPKIKAGDKVSFYTASISNKLNGKVVEINKDNFLIQSEKDGCFVVKEINLSKRKR